MDERLDDRVAAEIRARLMQQVVADRERRSPSLQPAPTPRRGWLVPVVATATVAVVVAAVSIAILAAPVKPQPANEFQGEARMFGGSCGAVVTPAAVRDAVGAAVGRPVDTTRSQATASEALVTSLRAIGGLRCDWSSTAGGDDQSGLIVVAAPVGLAPEQVAATYCYGSSAGGPEQQTCTIDHRAHGVWFSGSLTIASGTATEAKARVAALGTSLTASAAEPDVTVPLRVRPAGSWLRSTDCAALVRSADLASVLEAPGMAGEPGNGGSEIPAGQTAADRRLGATPCIVSSDALNLELAVLPGAASIAPLVKADPTAKPLRLDAKHTATVITDPDGVRVVWVFDGVNALQVLPDGSTPTQIAPAIVPLLRALDAAR